MKRLVPLALTLLLLAACSDSNNSNNSADNPQTNTPPPNTSTVTVELTADQVIAEGDMNATGQAEMTLNLDDNSLSGTVTVSGIEPTAVTLNYAFAGERSQEQLFTLDAVDATTFELPATVLTETDLDRLLAGALYLRAVTMDFPAGALRGQVVPDGIEVIEVPMSGRYQVPAINNMATGTAAVTFDRSSSSVVLHLNALGVTDPIASHIHEALAGTNGDVLIALTQDPDDALHWFTEDGVLDAAGIAAFDAGGLYVNLHTAAFPPGELRGQVVPAGIEVVFTFMTGMDVSPPVTTTAVAVGATTVNEAAESISIHVNNTDLDDATGTSLRQAPAGQNGPEVAALTQDLDNPAHWLIVDRQLTASEFGALGQQGLYLTVASPTNPAGEIRGQIVPDASMPGPTLTQIQSDVFTASCTSSGCHSGTNPAAGQNLSSGQTFANVVGVTSTEQSDLARVAPGDPDASYLVHKIEGRSTISFEPMPLGQPMLPADQIQDVRDWIANGALDN